MCCDVALVLAVLFSGCKTAMILHALTTPLPKGEHRIDVVDEIDVMAFLLNEVLPLAVVALLFSTGIKIRARTLKPLNLALALAALIGVFACAIATYGTLVAMHIQMGVNLWTRIWWRFAS